MPDAVLACADRVELVDITPGRLRAPHRPRHVLAPGAAEEALGGFFTAERLAALRQLALGWLDERGLLDAAARAAGSKFLRWAMVEAIQRVPAGTGEIVV